MAPKMGANLILFLKFFAERRICEKRAGTRARTLPSKFKGGKKSAENAPLQAHVLRPLFFERQNAKICKNGPQKGSQNVTVFRGRALLGHLRGHSLVFNTKHEAKVLQKWRQGSKSDSKKGLKMRKSDSQRGSRKALNKTSLDWTKIKRIRRELSKF